LALLALPGVLALPVPAGAAVFGSNLAAHQSNSNVTCGSFNVFNGRVGCSVSTSGNSANYADTSASHVVPLPNPQIFGNQSGTITSVFFKPAPGAPAGPARLSVVEYQRSVYSTASPALVQDIADSANFTMQAGADGLVKVATNLPVRTLYDPATATVRFDSLVLSMLDNTTPIPADLSSTFLSGWISPFVDIPSTNGDLTLPLPADRRGNTTGPYGIPLSPFYEQGAWFATGEVLMQAVLSPGQAALINAGGARLAGGRVIVPVTCALDSTCRGLLELLGGGRAASTAKAKKRVRYGSLRFKIAAGKTKNLRVRLTRAGRRAARRGKLVKMTARAKVGRRVTRQTLALPRK
jgi:hypothetical protein